MQKKFKAYMLRNDGDETAIGIEQYDEESTYFIASIYVNPKPSNKDIFDLIAFYVMQQSDHGENALLRITIPIRAKYQWIQAYNGRIFVKRESTANIPFMQTRLLAEDALRRKTSIIETLDDGIIYRNE
ncbi:hypothetical protein R4Z09_10820 [Niallia oryzisoli]|uniref:Uncharacterized protein n=1 Tax=Niallia oryzisoli TaxID=1737571 RepID=A0ABZ2CI41_9BACI